MSNKANIMARESFWGSIVTYAGVSIGFLTTFLVLTAYLTPEEVGLTRVLIELATLLSGFAMLGLSTSISRYFPYFSSGEELGNEASVPHRGFFYWLMCVLAVGLPLALGGYTLLADWINPYFGKGSQLFQDYALAVLPLTIFIALWTVAELYAIQLSHLAIPRVIRELVLRLLLLACYLAYAFDWVSLMGFVALFVASYGLCMLMAYVYLGRVTRLSLQRERGFPPRELKRGFLRYTLLAVLSVVGTTLAGRMDMLMLAFGQYSGLREAAVFSIGFFMVSIIEIPTRAIIGLATARVARMMKEEDYPRVAQFAEQISRFQLLATTLLYWLVYANIDTLIGLMPNGAEYRGSADVFFILGLSKLIEVSLTISHPIINSSRYYQWSLYYTLLSVLVAFVANFYFIPLWDIRGAAMATLLTTLLGYLLLQGVIQRRLGINFLSWRMLGIVLVNVVLFALEHYLPHLNHWADLFVRSALIALVFVALVLSAKLCPEAWPYLRRKPR